MVTARKRALVMMGSGLAGALLASALVRLQVVIGLQTRGAEPFTVLIGGVTITGWIFFWAGLIRLVTGRDEKRRFGLLWLIAIAILCLPCAFATMTLALRGTKPARKTGLYRESDHVALAGHGQQSIPDLYDADPKCVRSVPVGRKPIDTLSTPGAVSWPCGRCFRV